MKVLLAAPERDLLTSYKKLLETKGHDITIAFDGFQVMSWLRERRFAFVVLDRSLPRVEHEELIKLVNELKLPAIVLQKKRMNTSLLCRESLASSYLTYPFKPEEFFERMQEVLRKTEEGQELRIEDIHLDPKAFLLDGKVRVTNEEIDILKHLIETRSDKNECDAASILQLPVRHGMYYVNALNQKFIGLGKKVRIQYEMNKGYGLVRKYE